MWVFPFNEPKAVLQRRQAICMGYAKLFVACCRSIGIESASVSGNTRYGGESYEWNARRSTSERRLAKQQRHKVVCCVKTANFCRPGGAVPEGVASRIG